MAAAHATKETCIVVVEIALFLKGNLTPAITRIVATLAETITQVLEAFEQNAGNGEEDASASEQLSAPAKSINDIVADWDLLVDGVSARGNSKDRPKTMRSQGSPSGIGIRKVPDLTASNHSFHEIAAESTSH